MKRTTTKNQNCSAALSQKPFAGLRLFAFILALLLQVSVPLMAQTSTTPAGAGTVGGPYQSPPLTTYAG